MLHLCTWNKNIPGFLCTFPLCRSPSVSLSLGLSFPGSLLLLATSPPPAVWAAALSSKHRGSERGARLQSDPPQLLLMLRARELGRERGREREREGGEREDGGGWVVGGGAEAQLTSCHTDPTSPGPAPQGALGDGQPLCHFNPPPHPPLLPPPTPPLRIYGGNLEEGQRGGEREREWEGGMEGGDRGPLGQGSFRDTTCEC